MEINTWDRHETGIVCLAFRDSDGSRQKRLSSICDKMMSDKYDNLGKISYIEDHKGILTISWHSFDAILATRIGLLWHDIGNEPMESVEHVWYRNDLSGVESKKIT